MPSEENKREQWRNKTESILSSLGYCIGVGNVWRFPYLCYRSGGGAFLVSYLIMLVFCGIPLYFLESSVGQFSSGGCLTVFNIAPLFKGAGIAIIVVNIIVCTYFVILYAYAILYLYYSFQPILPWSQCGNIWNTKDCFDNSFNNSTNLMTSSEEFFNNEILKISSSIDETGSIVWPLFIANTIAWMITYLCMCKGIKSIGRAMYFTSTVPFIILLVLLVRGVTLPGALDGIYYYVYPQWEQLISFKVWCDAAVQIFFSLGPGWGGIINIASYNSFHYNNKWDCLIIPVCSSATSIVAGFVVFSVLGFMSHETGIPVSSVASSGPGLAFITYPEAISRLPLSNLWAILFFLMLIFLGLSSIFVRNETVITSITDEFLILRHCSQAIVLCACCFMWASSTIFTTNSGIYWLTLIDWYSASIPIILISLVEVIMLGWMYGASNFSKDIRFMSKEKISYWWIISWRFITPAILIAMFVVAFTSNTEAFYDNHPYPQWAVDIGWTSCYVSIACIPLYMGYHLLYIEQGDCADRIASSFCPTKDWGPLDKTIRLRWFRQVKLQQVDLELDRTTVV